MASDKSIVFMSSLYIAKNNKTGYPYIKEDGRNIRYKFDLPNKYIDIVLGGSVKFEVSRATLLS